MKSARSRVTLYVAALPCVLLAGCSKDSEANWEPGVIPPAAEVANVTFDQHIRPIFKAACFECHGEKKQKSGLRLDSREAAVKGGDDGAVFETGRSAESLLVKSIARVGDEEHWMPPIDKGKPLTLEQVALVRAWIDQGAR
jgi:hypothetical protein